MNVDFNWHLYCMILFELERGSRIDSKPLSVTTEGRLTANAELQRLDEVFPAETAAKNQDGLINEMGYVFRRNVDIALLQDEGICGVDKGAQKDGGKYHQRQSGLNKEKKHLFPVSEQQRKP